MLAVGLNFASAIVRGLAWRTVVVEAVPRPHPRLLDVFSAFFIGVFANGVLPGRVGEVARVGVLIRHMPPQRGLWPALLGSVVAHRLLEILPSIGLIVWVLAAAEDPRLGVDLVAHRRRARGVLLLLLGILMARRHENVDLAGAGRVRAAITRVRQGLGVLRRGRAALAAAALQSAAWGLQLAAVWAAMRAFHLVLPLIAAGVVLALMNVALIVPLWPGNVGLQQAAIALPLVSYGVVYSRGFAYGIGLQVIESSVGYVFGILFLLREGIGIVGLKTLVRTGEPHAGDDSAELHENAA